MSGWDPDQFPFVPQPFRFKGWDDRDSIIGLPPPSIDEFISDHEKSAERFESLGMLQAASKAREEAQWWRQLLSSSNDPKTRICSSPLWDEGHRINNALLAQTAVCSEGALIDLYLLTQQLLRGIHALAAHEVNGAGALYLHILTESVDAFEALARQKPDEFRAKAKGNFGIPGIISPFREKTKSNEKFVTLLEVGKELPFSLPTGGKGNALSVSETPSNLWAVRLYNYIEGARSSHTTWIANGSLVELMRIKKWTLPSWLTNATRLAPFSNANWSAWFEIAWQVVMIATKDEPELEPELAVIGKAAARKRPKYCKTLRKPTQMSNMRAKIKGRLKEAFKQLAAKESGR